MNAISVLLVCIIFGAIFWLAGKHLGGGWRPAVQFLAGAIIVVVLLLYLLGLFGHSTIRIP